MMMIIKDGKHITTERRKIVYSANLKENCDFKSCFFVSAFLFFFIPYLILTTPPHTLDPLNNKSILGSVQHTYSLLICLHWFCYYIIYYIVYLYYHLHCKILFILFLYFIVNIYEGEYNFILDPCFLDFYFIFLFCL
jgi:hypothetical protein